MQKKGTILSGMRPTGALHLGNYFGALENWVRLQDEYNCFFFVADYHALTTGYDDTEYYKDNITNLWWIGLQQDSTPKSVHSFAKLNKRARRASPAILNEPAIILAV